MSTGDHRKATGYDGVEILMFEGEPGITPGLRDAGLASSGIGTLPGSGKNAVSASSSGAEARGYTDPGEWWTLLGLNQ
jgi:D-psicose/D-tagatose/L-ribulose 3-epimerase